MKEFEFKEFSVILNENTHQDNLPYFLGSKSCEQVTALHKQLDCYTTTPLVELRQMAKNLGIKAMLVKDESQRFGLKAFKGLGGIYALFRVICCELSLDPETTTIADLKDSKLAERIERMVFATATDGNHGKGVSWAAAQFGCKAHIFMPKGSVEARVQAVCDVNSNATVEVTSMGYDDTVRYVAKLAKENGWHLIQDTSWQGYEQVPTWLIQGYTTMVAEAFQQMDQMNSTPTHVFVQSGVGSMPCGVIGRIANMCAPNPPFFSVVEPRGMACAYTSAKANDSLPHAADPQVPSIMAGLNCAEPCTIAWPCLRDFANAFFACDNSVTEKGMQLLAHPSGTDAKIISGESGAVCVGLVNSLPEEVKEIIGLNENSIVLCINTEGDTDPENYQKVVNSVPNFR